MRQRIRILNLSAWLALLSVLFIPGKVYTEGSLITEYGFPFRFLTQYHNHFDKSRWLITDVNIQLLEFLFNVLFIYLCILAGGYLIRRLKAKRTEETTKL